MLRSPLQYAHVQFIYRSMSVYERILTTNDIHVYSVPYHNIMMLLLSLIYAQRALLTSGAMRWKQEDPDAGRCLPKAGWPPCMR